jgi:hypothetical protein
MLMALLASIFLNGVNIDGVRNQSFEKCKSARIEERGDVRLECPGYQVEAPPPGARPASFVPGGAISVRKVKAGEPQIVLEITRLLSPGPNKILFAATKHFESGRKSQQPSSYLKITVGEGEAGGTIQGR